MAQRDIYSCICPVLKKIFLEPNVGMHIALYFGTDRRNIMKTLILGVGNLLWGDEGIGVHAARELLEEELPEGTKVLDVGTSILDTLTELEKSERVIVLDAIKAEGIPGTVYRLDIDCCESPNDIASMHGFDIFALLALTGRNMPTEVIALGIEPASLDWSTKLSPQVSKALPFLLDSVKREIRGQDPYFRL
jgi:hydrogenase maturation protease